MPENYDEQQARFDEFLRLQKISNHANLQEFREDNDAQFGNADEAGVLAARLQATIAQAKLNSFLKGGK